VPASASRAHVGSGAGAAVRRSGPTRAGRPPGRGLSGSRPPSADAPRERIAEIQCSRLLAATVGALVDGGYEHATVAHITRRAGVSRRTFYELFEGRDECIVAVIDDVASQVRRGLREAGLGEFAWRERMRKGLWKILCFLDREPALAQVLVVHTSRGSGRVLQARERILAELIAAVDEGRRESAGPGRSAGAAGCSGLTAEGVVGAALLIVQTRLARGRGEQLRALLGELTAIVVLPYQGAAVARREQERPAPSDEEGSMQRAALAGDGPLVDLPMRITYRTARVLEGIGSQPGASNRQVADYAGIGDQGQVSKLLSRLERLGLLANGGRGHAQGQSNAWTLTETGRLVAQSIATHQGPRS
jgi:AcrR family transcriptional regulator